MEESPAELLLAKHLKELGLAFVRDYRFEPKRLWRADFFIEPNILIEIEGGIWIKGGGRHNRGKGYQEDLKKYRTATRLGFCLYRFSSQEVLRGEAKQWIEENICKHSESIATKTVRRRSTRPAT